MINTAETSHKGYILLPNGKESSFTLAELACRHCGLYNYHPGFLPSYQAVREKYGKAMIPTSGCRCKIHNDSPAVGGHPKSSHICDELPYRHLGQLGAFGVDTFVLDNHERGVLHRLFWEQGFSVGHNYSKSFIHSDLRGMFGMSQIMFPY